MRFPTSRRCAGRRDWCACSSTPARGSITATFSIRSRRGGRSSRTGRRSRLPSAGTRPAVDTTLFLPVEQSGWFVLRAWNARAEEPVLDLYPFASTSPIYVTVAGAPVRSPADAEFFVRWSDRVIAAARAHTGWLTTAERDSVLTLFGRARAFYADEAATR